MLYEKLARNILNNNIGFKNRNRQYGASSDKLLDEIDKHLNRQVHNITRRNKWIEAQKRRSYDREYDRLKGIVSSGLPHHAMTIKGINLRMGKLKELASKSVHGQRHEIYHEDKDEEGEIQINNDSSTDETRKQNPDDYYNCEVCNKKC